MNLSIIKQKVAKFPQNPGVYIFRDAKKEIIYIGKATSLKSRVGSYFRDYRGSDRPIEMMIHQVADIEVQETNSVLEALILESNLIKKHQPKYNVKEKDDKSFSYIVVTKEDFPRFEILRKTDLGADKRLSVSQSKRPKDTKSRIAKTFGPYTSKKQIGIVLKILRKIFPYHAKAQKTEDGCLDFQIGLCPGPYVGAISKTDYAKNIRGIKMILEGKMVGLLKKMKKEMLEFSEKEEFEKANEWKKKIFALNHIRDVALIDRNESVSTNQKLPTTNFRIEAYDISNISGEHAVGSMVVFENNEPKKSEYRKFKIKTVTGANDVAMMAEVLFRRFKRQDWKLPNLIFLDGGQGHLNMAKKVLRELQIEIPLVAVAKGASRKNLNFKFHPPRRTNEFQMTKFSKEIQNILENKNLVKNIMDEAHRFAIGYHRKLRKKSFIN